MHIKEFCEINKKYIEDRIDSTENYGFIDTKDIKTLLRISYQDSDEDNFINFLIKHAISIAETFLNKKLFETKIYRLFKKNMPLYEGNKMPLNQNYFIKKINNIGHHTTKNKRRGFGYDIDQINNYIQIYEENDHYRSGKILYNISIEYIASSSKEYIPEAIKYGIMKHVVLMYDHDDSNLALNQQIKNLYIPYRKINL